MRPFCEGVVAGLIVRCTCPDGTKRLDDYCKHAFASLSQVVDPDGKRREQETQEAEAKIRATQEKVLLPHQLKEYRKRIYIRAQCFYFHKKR